MRSAARRRACEGRDAVGHDDASGGFFARGNDAEKTKVGGGGGRERTSGEGGFMIVLHASGTDSLADRLRFSRAARPGWWARICSERRGSRCERRVQKRGRVGGGGGTGQRGTAARNRERRRRRDGAAHPYLTERAFRRQEVDGVKHRSGAQHASASRGVV